MLQEVDTERRRSAAILGSPFNEVLMARRFFLRQMMALPLLGLTAWSLESTHKSLKVMIDDEERLGLR